LGDGVKHPPNVASVPVFDTFVNPHKPANAAVVGHIFAIIPWITYFKDMLMGMEDTE
jgi:hypothetical protein